MIHYHVALLSFAQQTLKISVNIPASSDVVTVSLPTWIPGSYKIRDFARNLGEFDVVDDNGKALAWEKVDKQTWRIQANSQPCTLSYTVVANDYSVRGAFLNDEYAFMNGTSVFVDVVDMPNVQRHVTFDNESVPDTWSVYTAMPFDDAKQTYTNQSFAELIDHPIYWGVGQLRTFTVENVEFSFLLSGTQPVDIDRICDDLKPICQHHLTLFPSPAPIDKYLFITLLADTGFGGLEHRDSTVLMYPRFDLPMHGEPSEGNDGYIDYLSLCSHEFFHTWHVKRLRPSVMLAPDLSKEVYTNQLWIYEGITSFYDDLTVARAQKMSPEHYTTIVGRHLTRLYHTPGRHKQTPAESSFDAWTRFYQQDAHSNNHIVSYYTKGGIVAMGLDLLLRQETDHAVTLDTLMAHLWTHYGKDEHGTPDDVIQRCCAELGVDVSDYLQDVVYGTKDVDLASLLPEIGLSLQFRARESSQEKGGTSSKLSAKHDVGVQLKSAAMGCKVTQIQQDSAAEQAGLMIGDVIVAANSYVVDESLIRRLIQAAETGEKLQLSVARQGRLLTLDLPIQTAQQNLAYLDIVDREKYLKWLGVKAED